MTTKQIPACILVRVSTSKQETARQISELQAAASGKGWNVVEICEETISGRADSSERAGLQHVEAMARAGKIKKVLVHEISRIARKSSVVHSFVEMLEDCGVSLYWHSQGMETMLANGKRNPATGIMLAMLAEMARSEVETLRERINSGLAEARRKGVTLGRPKGTKPTSDFLDTHKDIVKLLRAGQSVRNAAKISGKGASTVQRVKAGLSAISG